MPRMCFSYQSDLPPGIESRAVAPPGLRRMPAGACFSYPSSVPVPLCRMPFGSCFNYLADVRPGTTSRDTTPPVPPSLRRMPSMCFRY